MSLTTVPVIGLGPLGFLVSGSLATIMPPSLAISIPALIIVTYPGYAVCRPAWQHVQKGGLQDP